MKILSRDKRGCGWLPKKDAGENEALRGSTKPNTRQVTAYRQPSALRRQASSDWRLPPRASRAEYHKVAARYNLANAPQFRARYCCLSDLGRGRWRSEALCWRLRGSGERKAVTQNLSGTVRFLPNAPNAFQLAQSLLCPELRRCTVSAAVTIALLDSTLPSGHE